MSKDRGIFGNGLNMNDMENLNALVNGHNLNAYQIELAKQEFDEIRSLLGLVVQGKSQLDNVKAADTIFKAMSEQNISEETYQALGKLHDEICDPVNKGNWPIRININYV